MPCRPNLRWTTTRWTWIASANFVDNAVRYETTLRFINGNAKTMLSAIQGQ